MSKPQQDDYYHHMGVKQVYVTKGNETFWKRAEAKAKRRGISFSEYVSRLVRNDVIDNGGDLTLDEAVTELHLATSQVTRLALAAQPGEGAVPDDAS